jgi:hypothetical protein
MLAACSAHDDHGRIAKTASPVSSALGNGTYIITSGSKSVDGGFGYWNATPYVQLYPTNAGTGQQWAWDGSRFSDVQVAAGGSNGATGPQMADNGDGTVTENPNGDTWTVSANGSGYTIADDQSGRYLSDLSGTLGMSATQTVWQISAFGSCTPQCNGLACGNDGCGGSCGTCSQGQSCSGGQCVSSGGGNEYNDTDPSIVYSLGGNGAIWNHYTGGAEDFHADEHSTNVYASSFTINFRGTDFQWIGKRGPNYGIASVYLDGQMVGTLDNYNPTELDQQSLYSVAGLSNGNHVFKAAIGGYPNPAKNGASSNTYQTLDAFITSGTPLVLPAFAASGGSVARNGAWTCGPDNTDLSGSHCWSNAPGASMSIGFNGTGIEVYARPDGENGMTDVYLDGSYRYTYDGFGLPYDSECGDCVNAQNAITMVGLSPGSHSLSLVVSPNKNPASENYFTQIDEFMILP